MPYSYEELLRQVGEFGRYQKIFCVVVFLCCIPNAFCILMFIFIHATPDHRCWIPGLDDTAAFNESERQDAALVNLIPSKLESGKLKIDQCHRLNYSLVEITEYLNNFDRNLTYNLSTQQTIKCDHGWVFNGPNGLNTATMELEMVCDQKWIAPLGNSAFMLGMFLASFAGKLSDKYGRKNTFLVTTAGQFLFTGILAFAKNAYTYVGLIVLLGAFELTNYITLYVIGTEIVLPKRRPLLAFIPFTAFSFGYAATALFAYLLQDWKYFLYGTSLVGLLYITTIWLVPESPRWLIDRGRINEGKKVLRNIARINKRKVDLDELFQQGISVEEKNESAEIEKKEGRFIRAITDHVMCKRFFTVYFQWFVVSMIYFVIMFGISDLTNDRYWGTVLMGVLELPSYLSAVFCIKRLGAIRTYSVAMCLAAGSCSLIPFFKHADLMTATTAVAMLGKFGANIGFYIAYILPAELTPTLIRGTSISVGNAFSKLSGFVAIYFIYLGLVSNIFIPYIIMCAIALVSVILSLFFIPETRNTPLPSTMEQAISNKRVYGLRIWKRFKFDTITSTSLAIHIAKDADTE